jgi:4-amino-4-deoxy-L-arabinose transferase-like glycosyltransferase
MWRGLETFPMKKHSSAAAGIAALVYCLLAVLLILQNPGLQYDEALVVSGAVHLRHSRADFDMPHDPGTWTCVLGRCLPLMNVRYVGPVKDYLAVPLFAIFGPKAWVIRVLSMLLAALGVFGISKLIAEQEGITFGLAVGLALAIHPAYLDLTVFDNNAIAAMMAALGLLCLSVGWALPNLQKTARAPLFWIGAAAMFGIWTRANFAWLLAAIAIATLLVAGRKLGAVPLAHWIAAALGGLIVGIPFLWYQIQSHGGTWEGLGMFVSHEPLLARMGPRIVLLAETLLSDREHRAMWAGPAMPDWQRWLFLAIVLAACVAALLRAGRWPKFCAIAFLALAAILLTSRQTISEHHLIALLPLACAVTVLVAGRNRIVAAVVAAIYIVCAGYWDVSMIRGLNETGGVGVWSDSINDLAAGLPRGRTVKALDWGLAFNLYVLSDGQIRAREFFPEPPRPWPDEIREGGVFVLFAPAIRQFPEASAAFERALAESSAAARKTSIPGYAQIVEVEPNTAREPQRVSMSGVYDLEQNRWRWTHRSFSITFSQPGDRLALHISIPLIIIEKLGAITMSATINSHPLGHETIRAAGDRVFERDVPPDWLHTGPNTFEFALDKSLPPTPQDARDLGIILLDAELGK